MKFKKILIIVSAVTAVFLAALGFFTRVDKVPASDLKVEITPERLARGKYLTENVYLVYSGQLEVGLDPIYQRDGLGLKHSLDLEYRIYPNLLLELQYNYDRLLLTERDDKRIQIRHFFAF